MVGLRGTSVLAGALVLLAIIVLAAALQYYYNAVGVLEQRARADEAAIYGGFSYEGGMVKARVSGYLVVIGDTVRVKRLEPGEAVTVSDPSRAWLVHGLAAKPLADLVALNATPVDLSRVNETLEQLEQNVTALQNQTSSLEQSVSNLESRVSSLEQAVSSLQEALSSASHVEVYNVSGTYEKVYGGVEGGPVYVWPGCGNCTYYVVAWMTSYGQGECLVVNLVELVPTPYGGTWWRRTRLAYSCHTTVAVWAGPINTPYRFGFEALPDYNTIPPYTTYEIRLTVIAVKPAAG